MSELESSKTKIVSELERLCAHCANRHPHRCPIQSIALRIKAISGVPLIVNNEFRGVLWR